MECRADLTSERLRRHMNLIARYYIFRPAYVHRKKRGVIRDLIWHKSFITKAVQYKRDVIPAFFSGRNSNFFYTLANLRKFFGIKANIEMLYLPDEMFRQRDKEIILIFGKRIPWQTFDQVQITSRMG